MLNFFWKLVVLIYNFIYQMHRSLYGYPATSCLSKVGHITVHVKMKLGMHDCLQVTDCTQWNSMNYWLIIYMSTDNTG